MVRVMVWLCSCHVVSCLLASESGQTRV
ncbi:hypothetical protein SEVIR_2G363250v4 [Setaria viridis]